MSQLNRLQAPVSFEEFNAMPKEDGWNYELIEGMVMMSPRPSFEHQDIAGNLYHEFRNTLKDSPCKPILELDLLLDNNCFVPDLMVICNEEFKGKHHTKPPMIVIEVVSPTIISRDCITKRRKYEQLGISEYWIVSPEEKCITVFDFIGHTDEIYCIDKVKSSVLPEITINLTDIFT